MQHTAGTVTVSQISSPGAPGFKNPNDVKFKVAYAADFKGEKTLPEGETIVASKESAEHFASLGMGSIVTDEAPAAEISSPGAPEEVKETTNEVTETVTDQTPADGGKKGKGAKK